MKIMEKDIFDYVFFRSHLNPDVKNELENNHIYSEFVKYYGELKKLLAEPVPVQLLIILNNLNTGSPGKTH